MKRDSRMQSLWRLFAIVATFLVVGYTTMHVVIARSVAKGMLEYSVRLGGAMAGLFVGGAVATVLALWILLRPKRGGSIEPD